MIGYRLWSVGLDDNKKPQLMAATAPYVWQGNVVGETLDYLAEINQDESLYLDKPTGQWVSWWPELNGGSIDDEIFIPEIGFWAFKSYWQCINAARSFDGSPMIVGAVNGFGKIAVHEYGFRSEFSQILGLNKFIPCLYHGLEKGNILFGRDDSVIALCSAHHNKQEILANKPRVQYQHDLYLKDISRRYEAPLMDGHQLMKLKEK